MRRMLMTLTLIVVLGAAVFLMHRTSAVAGVGYSARDVSGEYVFTFAEIRIVQDPSSGTPVMEYCDHAGTLSADGAGTILAHETYRCSVEGPGTATGTVTYTVDPSGSVLFTEPGEPAGSAGHGQIVDRGRAILIDGTTETNANILLFHGLAMQR